MKTAIHEMAIKDGGRSVLSDKDAIKGLPKTKSASPMQHDAENCESPLQSQECIQGKTLSRQRKSPC